MDQAAARIRAAGLRVTPGRVAVLRVVDGEPHIDADRVAVRARQSIGALSTQAVYDALRALAEAGLLRRIEPAGAPALYETRVGDNHHHLICRTCGRIEDVRCAAGAAPCLNPDSAWGFSVDEAEVTFWGQCPACLTAVAAAAPAGGVGESAPVRRAQSTNDAMPSLETTTEESS
ncbi:MAG: transcriptional repressor [Austwickia sp.]|jgi:Fur family transcriptional regulator, stress-responsive regulator|nr:transcriptional repressor [Austwickia sp.]MBK8437709.1 transcriptional repressor [Austwickia sp.]MBK9100020.1 transcriptional repressor [Austwickia sp.]